MPVDLIAASYPIFAVLIAVEVGLSIRRGVRLYRWNDALTDLACGVGSQALGLLWKVATLAVYAWAFQYRFFTLPAENPLVWVAALLYVDLAFYWWHRWSHEVSVLWAGHVVHHQSEDYNLAVALRQEWLSGISHAPFYLPMALLGFPPSLLLTHVAISLLYQFWIHTELVGRMGAFEWVFNAPMHHRVHHAVNPQYLDKNYGGIFIFWDRLFGTYQEESEPCVYGTVKPIASWNSVWANFIVWRHMWQVSSRTARWADKLGVWLRSPAWSPPDQPPYPIPAVDRARVVKYDTPSSRSLQVWSGAQFLVSMIAVSLAPRGALPLWATLVVVALVLWAMGTLAGIMEGKAWAKPTELARVVATTGVCAALALTSAIATVPAGVLWSLAAATAAVGVGVLLLPMPEPARSARGPSA